MAALHASSADARGAWLRVSPRGLAELPELLASADGRERRVPMTRTRAGDFSVCTSGQCELALTLDHANAAVASDGRATIGVAARVTSSAIGVRYEQSWACAFASRAECNMQLDTARAGAPVLSVDATLALAVDAPTGMTSLALSEARVLTGLDGGDVSVEGTNVCGQVWCTVANVTGATSLLAGRANDELVARVRHEVEARVCRGCAAGCPRGARCEAGLCMAGPRCVPAPFAAETTLSSEDARTDVLLAVALADEANARAGGVELALRLSAVASDRHRCTPRVRAPAPEPLPRSVLDGAPERGHVRLAIGQATLGRALAALSQGGIGCRTIALSEVPVVGPAGLAGLFPSAHRISELGLEGTRISIAPLASPSVRVMEDGSLDIEVALEVDVESTLLGRVIRVANAEMDLRARAYVAMQGDTLALTMPVAEREVVVREVSGAAVLGASNTILRQSFEAIGAMASAVLPEVTSLDAIPLPGHVRLAAPPSLAQARGVRALVLDLELTR